jgi:hypothetical protein
MNTALSLIHQAYEEGWEELDRTGVKLTELPPKRRLSITIESMGI